LIDFDSAVVALQCAVEAQQRFLRYNEGIAGSDRILVRVSVSLGEVMIVDGDLFGDEVNISARIQQLADPGGICITREVYDRVRSKLSLLAVSMGPQKLKNIRQPIEVYKVLIKDAQGSVAVTPNDTVELLSATLLPADSEEQPTVSTPAFAEPQHAEPSSPSLPAQSILAMRRWSPRHLVPVFSVAALALAGMIYFGGAWGNFFSREDAGRVHAAAVSKQTLLIGYFENRTNDPRDEWMSTGLADMLITELQRNSGLRVLGRPQIDEALHNLNVSGTQMNPANTRAAAQLLSSDYMLCGAFVREGSRLRCDLQLFEVQSGELLLADSEQGESVLPLIDHLAARLRQKLR
jgi:adenylate cyclase